MNDEQIQDLFDAAPSADEQHAAQVRADIDTLPDSALRACLVMQRLQLERLRAALSELVALHDLEASLPAWPFSPDPDREKRADYARRTPAAWEAARKALGLGAA